METQDKQNVKKKAFAISSIMKNPKLAQAIWDSFDSNRHQACRKP